MSVWREPNMTMIDLTLKRISLSESAVRSFVITANL